jgi:hypothetical protein
MSDDHFIIIVRQLVTDAEKVVAAARQIKRDNDVVTHVRADALSLKEAAFVAECSIETIRRRCERTVAKKGALGGKFQGAWIIDMTLLLDWIEKKRGPDGRRIAEERLQRVLEERPR